VRLIVLKGVSDGIGYTRNGFLRGEARFLDHPVDFLFDTVTIFEAVLEADEVPGWVLVLGISHCWGDLFLLAFYDTVALGFDPGVGGAV
jgi:hypothetical protein